MDNNLDEFDDLLRSDLLHTPDDFSAQVMQQIYRMPLPLPLPQPRLSWQQKLQNLALIAGGILGAVQLAAFMFGIWAASSVA